MLSGSLAFSFVASLGSVSYTLECFLGEFSVCAFMPASGREGALLPATFVGLLVDNDEEGNAVGDANNDGDCKDSWWSFECGNVGSWGEIEGLLYCYLSSRRGETEYEI